MTLVAQISDPHICRRGELLYGIVDSATALRRAVSTVNALNPQPDLVIVSGDLANDGAAESYDHLIEILDELHRPWLAIPGNHDVPEVAAEVLVNHCFSQDDGGWGPCSGVVDLDGVRIIGLNSVCEGEPSGVLDPRDLEATAVALAGRGDRMAVVVVHHPPVALGLAAMDAMRLDDASAGRLGDLVDDHAVDTVLVGHVHRASATGWRGSLLLSCPSPAFSIAMDLDPATPLTVSDEPAAILVHRLIDGVHTAHVHAVGERLSIAVNY